VIEPMLNHLPDEEFERLSRHGGALAESVRDLVEAVIRSSVGNDELDDVRAEVERLTARLRVDEVRGSVGIQSSRSGQLRAWGNPVIGVRNPLAPPLTVHHDDGGVWAETVLGSRYEGPPGHVHGGISSLLLDHVLGEASNAAGRPGMTATLSLSYRKAVPLGPVRIEAKALPGEGIKTVVQGRLVSLLDEPAVCVEAEGLFILPRWARERMASD
jgi:acyl-coenzyme A thioesterase PaaI-like protein